MRLAVVSDTHMPRFGRRLPPALVSGLRAAAVDLVVHLGDFTSPDVIGQLEAIAGNNDGPELVARFGRSRILELDRVRLGLVHGDLGRGGRTIDRAASSFPNDRLDAVLFGHSHIPVVERRNGLLLVNPGSPTDKRREPMFSYALLEVSDGRIEAELRTYASRTAA